MKMQKVCHCYQPEHTGSTVTVFLPQPGLAVTPGKDAESSATVYSRCPPKEPQSWPQP